MKKTKQEIIADLTAFIGENQSDEAIALIDNISDSMEETNENLTERCRQLEEKCDQIDKQWRQKYIDRFNNANENNENTENNNDTLQPEDSNKKYTFENLFEEG